MLCQNAGRLEVIQPDTERSHPSGSASAGRTTYTFGQALIKACELMTTKLVRRAALALMIDEPGGFTLVPGAVRHLPTGKELPLTVMGAMLPRDGPRLRGRIPHARLPRGAGHGQGFSLGLPRT